jgi:hypothetical protein
MTWKLMAGLVLVGGALLGLTLTGCKPSGAASGKPSATNVAKATPGKPGGTNVAKALPRPAAPTNQLAAIRPAPKTNIAPPALRPPRPPAAATNVAGARLPGAALTNAAAGKHPAAAKAASPLIDRLRKLMASPYFYPVVAITALCVAFGVVALFQFLQSRSRKTVAGAPAEAAGKAVARPLVKKARKAPIHLCNVLQVGGEERQLWQFSAKGRGFVLSREQTSLAGEALPTNAIAKDWTNLWQRKVNIAWLPPEQVFLRVAQFPTSDFDETVSMVELQMEKLSPMPVGQIVWSIRVLPHTQGSLQTVIVMIAARDAVEEFLGKLEGQGYLADRLEMPRLDQLQATAITGDGAWIYPDPASANPSALVAWWYAGVLQSLALITLPAGGRAASLREQLLQMAWAGELEGWLAGTPTWHLVADPAVALEWEPALREGLEQPVEVIAPLAPAAVAALTAQRVAQAEPEANLLPPEFSTRYQQQFVDRLWMRGLGSVIALYLVGVMIYFAWLQFFEMGTGKVELQVANLGPTYTNTLQLKARLDVLKSQQDLKSAALDCWKVVADLLPTGVMLEQYNFNDGKRLSLNGTAPSDAAKELSEFDTKIRKAEINGERLFDALQGDRLTYHPGPAGTLLWNCTLELKRGDTL